MYSAAIASRDREVHRRVLTKGVTMTAISGKTTNGFTYEGEYELIRADRVRWSATYRRDGVFFGIRHGGINELLGVSPGEVQQVVMDDIDFTWTRSG